MASFTNNNQPNNNQPNNNQQNNNDYKYNEYESNKIYDIAYKKFINKKNYSNHEDAYIEGYKSGYKLLQISENNITKLASKYVKYYIPGNNNRLKNKKNKIINEYKETFREGYIEGREAKEKFNRSGAKNNEIYNIIINGHGLINSNRFIIIPNNIDMTFYTEKGKSYFHYLSNNIHKNVRYNHGNKNHFIKENTILNDMHIQLLSMNGYDIHKRTFSGFRNFSDVVTIKYSGLITTKNITPIISLPAKIFKKYGFTIKKICRNNTILEANANGAGAGANANGAKAGANANGAGAGSNANGANAGSNANGANAGSNANGAGAGANANGANAGANANGAGANANYNIDYIFYHDITPDFFEKNWKKLLSYIDYEKNDAFLKIYLKNIYNIFELFNKEMPHNIYKNNRNNRNKILNIEQIKEEYKELLREGKYNKLFIDTLNKIQNINIDKLNNEDRKLFLYHDYLIENMIIMSGIFKDLHDNFKKFNTYFKSNYNFFKNIILYYFDSSKSLFCFNYGQSIINFNKLLSYYNKIDIWQFKIFLLYLIFIIRFSNLDNSSDSIINLLIKYNPFNYNQLISENFNKIIDLSYHYHNNDILPKQIIVNNNYFLSLGVILNYIDTYNKYILFDKKILCHGLNCRNYTPIHRNRLIKNELNGENGSGAGSGAEAGAEENNGSKLRRTNSNVHHLIRMPSSSNEYKDMFENMIQKCFNILRSKLDKILISEDLTNNEKMISNNLDKEIEYIKKITKDYSKTHYLLKNDIKYLISILRRKEEI